MLSPLETPNNLKRTKTSIKEQDRRFRRKERVEEIATTIKVAVSNQDHRLNSKIMSQNHKVMSNRLNLRHLLL